MRTRTNLIMLAAIAALASCKVGGGDDQPVGDDTGGDDEPSIDSAAAPDGPLPVTEEVTCQAFTRVVTQASGARTEVSYWFAHVSVGIEDDFIVEQCDPTWAATLDCPAGSTCTGDLYPSGQNCNVSRSSGQFFGGELWVYCGSTSAVFDAAGTMTSEGDSRYQTVRVTY